MADIVLAKNVGSLIALVAASAAVTATAGGTGDATAVTGASIDRASHKMPLSAAFGIAFETVLSASATLSITSAKLQHSADGSTWADFLTFDAPGVVATGAGTVDGIVKLDADVSTANRYLRLVWTPDLSASGTDTLKAQALAVLAGGNVLPAV